MAVIHVRASPTGEIGNAANAGYSSFSAGGSMPADS